MRILRLDLDTGEELDLHPYVTVLGGLDPGTQHRVAEQITRIARGDVEGLGGLIETHDMLVDIDQDRIGSLELPADADVIVNAEQLPGARLVDQPAAESQRQRVLIDEISGAEAELQRVITEMTTVGDQIRRDTVELDDARRNLDEFAITAHESAVRAVGEAEQLARRRLESQDPVLAPEPVAEETPEQRRRAELASQLEAHRRRHGDLEVLLDEERLGLLGLLERLEAERANLDALRAELGAEMEQAGAEERERREAEVKATEEAAKRAAEEAARRPTRADLALVDAAIRDVAAGPPEAPMVPSLPAAALADQVAAHRQRQREFDTELRQRGLDPSAIRQRLSAAQRLADEAAEDARPRTVSPEDDREIERLHDIINENVDKRDSRRHGKEATRLYEEANAELDLILDRYGFPTYAAYIMGRTAPAVDEQARRRHEEAVQQVVELQRELDEALTAIDQDPHGRMLRAERDQLWNAARELLGDTPDDVEDALRNLKMSGRVDWDAPDRLRELLNRLGVDTSNAGTTGLLLELADRWHTGTTAAIDRFESGGSFEEEPRSDRRLPAGFTAAEAGPEPGSLEDQVAQLQALVDEIFDRSTRLDAQLTDHETESEHLAAQVSAIEDELVSIDEQLSADRSTVEAERAAQPDPEAVIQQQLAVDPTVLAAREQATLTAARLERHHAAVERVDRLHAAIGEARRLERDHTGERDSIQAELATLRTELGKLRDAGSPLPPVEWELTDEGVGPIEWYLLGRVASLRSVSTAGSVPLVLNDAFRGLPAADVATLCGALARIGETVQVIYLGDELAVVEWVESQGLDRAAVVRPGQPAL